MNDVTIGALLALIVWAAVTGVDLVTFPQVLLSRPIVACTGAGLLLGDVPSGLRVGVLLELFALDVLPVGAARYPDYGPGCVGAVVVSLGGPWQETLGVAALFGLVGAILGGWSMQWLRQVNGTTVRRYSAGLAAGDAGTIVAVQHRGVAGDVVRSSLLAVVCVVAAEALAPHLPHGPRFTWVTAVAIGAGVAAAAGGAIRGAGRGARLRWVAVGTGIGLLLAALT